MTTENTNKNGKWYETLVGQKVVQDKYLHEGETCFDDLVTRVCSIFSNEKLKEDLKDALYNADFFPAGRSLYGAGCKGKFKASLSNCYILPSAEDDTDSINANIAEMENIFKKGGGCGVNLSKLRPRGARVNNAARTSTGSVSFLEKYDVSARVIGANSRRAALMIGLNCDHPDVEEFLTIKQNNDKIQGANLSILYTDEFMKAVRDNKDFELKFHVESTGENISKWINAREFFSRVSESANDYGEPGCIFIDTVRRHNLLSGYSDYLIEISNP